jgi:hypothetical protein
VILHEVEGEEGEHGVQQVRDGGERVLDHHAGGLHGERLALDMGGELRGRGRARG